MCRTWNNWFLFHCYNIIISHFSKKFTFGTHDNARKVKNWRNKGECWSLCVCLSSTTCGVTLLVLPPPVRRRRRRRRSIACESPNWAAEAFFVGWESRADDDREKKGDGLYDGFEAKRASFFKAIWSIRRTVCRWQIGFWGTWSDDQYAEKWMIIYRL